MSAYASVDLPDPFGPMIACTSFGETERSTPLTISVPSSVATCRFLISSTAKFATTSHLSGSGPGGDPRNTECSGSPEAPSRFPQRAILAGMPGNIGWTGAVVIILVLLLVFGPKRLPEMGRSLGRGMREFKDSISGEDKSPRVESHELTASDQEIVTP